MRVTDKSSIEWTDATWNPTTGCDRVSPGCDHCYALTLAARLKAMGQPKYQADGDPRTSGPGFGLTTHPDALDLPLRWRRPRRIFVNSMSDLFHADVPDQYIAQVFAVMACAPRHAFQLLTKRHARMRSLLSSGRFADRVEKEVRGCLGWSSARLPAVDHGRADAHLGQREWAKDPMPPLRNVWLGVSVEDQRWADIRIPALLETPAAVRWVSAEPLLGPVDLLPYVSHQCDCPGPEHLKRSEFGPGLDWVVVGGESGPDHRPLNPDWARSLRDRCVAAGVPFLFKQVGGRTPKSGGRVLDGRTWDEYPVRSA